MQDEERPPDPYATDAFSNAEVVFDLVAYIRDHPIAVGVIVAAIVTLFFWYMGRSKRR